MDAKKLWRSASLLVALSGLALPVFAVSPVKLTGSLTGVVRSSTGVPQMGAAVFLYDRYDKLVQKVLTSTGGDFFFDALNPDLYSLRVSATSFLPALKRNIAVQPGMQSVLAINLASVLSSIEIVYTGPRRASLMSDEWKWVLRSSMSTRPVLRVLPGLGDPPVRDSDASGSFSYTRGLVKVSSGEVTPFTALSNQPDLGTAFAFATSLFGAAQLQLSGNIGYAGNSELPMAGFRTSLSRSEAGVAGPQVKLTMQQVMLPARASAVLGSRDNLPALRTLSATVMDRAHITDEIELDYGASLDSVTFFDRLNYVSPFARLGYSLGRDGRLELGYSSGAPPIDLLHAGRDADAMLEQDIAALSLLPRISMRDGLARVQRIQNFEVGYSLPLGGGRAVSAGAYREVISNAALTMSGAGDLYDTDNLLPELSSNSSVFNIGGYTRFGYTASFSQEIDDELTVTVAYGSGGALRTASDTLATRNPEELRDHIRRSQQRWVMARVKGVIPGSGTRFVTGYQWTDYDSLVPGHVYLTQRIYGEHGWNVRLRQPVPSFPGVPGRLEATADLRNLLAQGYLPLTTSDGRRILLTHSPRAVRGGLSFIF
ncbi:MAG: TonB-dependent receptor [Acidobacteria bacterium]|nr:TonB-dependent receptor [Acidobacteriota bacterium]MBI3280335.1 TonB-dependent receptor [Acidobacteriota bacterium]